MESLAIFSASSQLHDEPIELLVADDDAASRSLVAVRALDAIGGLAVYEAADGPEAIQVALQRRPQLALLDVDMPRLGGVEVALVLRELVPDLRLALRTGDPSAYTDTARELGLPLFDKLDTERAVRWLRGQMRSCSRLQLRETLTLHCSMCGYGIRRSAPPVRCPMCQSEDAWVLTDARR
jgi:CheY-like chemotaxis protein